MACAARLRGCAASGALNGAVYEFIPFGKLYIQTICNPYGVFLPTATLRLHILAEVSHECRCYPEGCGNEKDGTENGEKKELNGTVAKEAGR